MSQLYVKMRQNSPDVIIVPDEQQVLKNRQEVRL